MGPRLHRHEGLARRARRLPPRRRRPARRAALDGVCRLRPRLLVRRRSSALFVLSVVQGRLPCRSGRVDGLSTRLQHRRLLRDQHQLAVVLRRAAMGSPVQIAGPRRAELRLGRRRHRRRGRAGPRLRPRDRPTGSATSGSTWSAASCASCCRSRCVGGDRAARRRASSRTSPAARASPRSPAARRSSPGGPVASQEAIKELGTNGGGFFNANSAHPFENPNALDQPVRDLPAAGDPVRAAPHLRPDGRRQAPGLRDPRRHGRRCWASLAVAARALEAGGPARRPARPAARWRARRPRFGMPGLGAVRRRRRPAPRPARSTRCTTRSPRSAAGCRCST